MSEKPNKNTAEARRTAMIEGPIAPILTKMTLYMMIGILSMMAFNLIDTFFVAQLGKSELAAMSFTFPVVMVLNGIALGLGTGASSVISVAIGRNNKDEVKRLTTDSLLLGIIVVALFVALGYLTIEPLFIALGASAELLPLIDQYMSIWYAGILFVVIPMIGTNALRATGDMKTPSLIMMAAIIVNLILDPLLIFGLGPFPEMRLEGAALATVIARAATFLFSLWILYNRERMITFIVPNAKAVIQSWKRILYVGMPEVGARLIIPVSIGIITRMVAIFGVEAVAAFGVASRLEFFVLSVVFTLSMVALPFVGQNHGAQKPDRIKTGLKYSYIFSLAWGGICLIIFLLLSNNIVALFNDDPDIVRLASLYLVIVSISFGLYGIQMISSSSFNALNKPLNSAFLSIVRMFILYVPLAWVGSQFYGVTGIFIAAAVANILSGGLGFIWIRKTLAGST
jgi:putative MATE family efflux protein